MSQNITYRGICSTCEYRSDCLALKNTLRESRSVFYCEEFNASAPKIHRGTAIGCRAKNVAVDDDEAASARGKGLCTNCNENGMCKLTCFGSLVIYCEEYS